MRTIVGNLVMPIERIVISLYIWLYNYRQYEISCKFAIGHIGNFSFRAELIEYMHTYNFSLLTHYTLNESLCKTAKPNWYVVKMVLMA